MKQAVQRHLRETGLPFQTGPDLCGLAARRDPSLGSLAESGHCVVIACYPRAVRWLFAAAGAPLPASGTTIVNLRVLTPEEAVAALPRPATAGGPECAVTPASADVSTGEEQERSGAEQWRPWFPVIDFDRCTQCMQCLNFCLFGVYGVDAQKRIQVLNPAACKYNCPACARVCPEAAIMFPKYPSSPINGEEVFAADLEREKMQIDTSALLSGDVYSLLRSRSELAQSRFSRERNADKALEERCKCLAAAGLLDGIPPDVLKTLTNAAEMIRRTRKTVPGTSDGPPAPNPEGL